MRAFAISSTALGPSPDNPTQRMDVPFHALIQVLKAGLATPTLLHAFGKLGRNVREEREILGRLNKATQTATTAEQIYEALFAELPYPKDHVVSPELEAGLRKLADSLLEPERQRVRAEIAALQARLKQLG